MQRNTPPPLLKKFTIERFASGGARPRNNGRSSRSSNGEIVSRKDLSSGGEKIAAPLQDALERIPPSNVTFVVLAATCKRPSKGLNSVAASWLLSVSSPPIMRSLTLMLGEAGLVNSSS